MMAAIVAGGSRQTPENANLFSVGLLPPGHAGRRPAGAAMLDLRPASGARRPCPQLSPTVHLHLVLPGLIWPTPHATAPAGELALPALERLLGLGERVALDARSAEAVLAGLFGVAADALPVAALRRLGEADGEHADAAASWLCADPVHLQFAREHLLLTEYDAGELDQADADTLIAALNETFADLGRFEAATPRRWYLRLTAATRALLHPVGDVVGRPVAQFLPEGEDARLWQRTMNEVQIVLHNQPHNQAREAGGQRPVNSLWFWGAGALPATLAAPAPHIHADEPVARGLARRAGIAARSPEVQAALAGDSLVVLDALRQPALQLDLERWRDALATLERDWFAPLDAALASGRLKTLTLSAPGDRAGFTLTVRAGQRWKFWRKPLRLDTLLRDIVPAPVRAELPAADRFDSHGNP